MNFLRLFVVAFFAVGGVALGPAQVTRAEEGHSDEHAKEVPHYAVKVPATAAEAWGNITAKVAETETYLADSKIEPVHEAGEQLEASVHVLREKSDMVIGDNKTKLAAALKQLDKAVDDLHHAAEDNDSGRAGLELKKIKGLLPLVEGLYPAGSLQQP